MPTTCDALYLDLLHRTACFFACAPGGHGTPSKVWGALPPPTFLKAIPGFWGQPDFKTASPQKSSSATSYKGPDSTTAKTNRRLGFLPPCQCRFRLASATRAKMNTLQGHPAKTHKQHPQTANYKLQTTRLQTTDYTLHG